MTKKFTLQELSNYNGLNNKPAYVGYNGKVYDVSKVFKNGEHAGVKAGTDLTEKFAASPHDGDIFSKFNVVGVLANECCSTKIFKASAQYSDIILRCALGIIFFAHGAQKLLGWFGGYGWTGTMGFLTNTVGLPGFLAALTILIEFFGGIAIIFGLFTRPAALGIFIVMLGAIFKVHLANGFFLDPKGVANGIEYPFSLLMISLYLMVKGAGKISLDRLIFGIKN